MERIEIFTGEQRRRRYIPQQRAKFVAMAMQPGYRSMAGKLIQLKVNQLARRHQNGDVTYMKNKILLSVTALFLSACSSVSPNMQLATEGNDQSEVIFIRPAAFAAGANAMLIGFNDQYFGSIDNNQFMKVKMDSGTYSFQVKANGSRAFSYDVTLIPNTTMCLKSSINPAAVGVAIIPLLANTISWFELSEIPCPDDKFFADYSEVKKS